MENKRILATLILLVLNSLAHAQYTGMIRGTVIDAESKTSIPGVAITVPGTNFGTLSDSLGRFKLSNLPVGRISITASMLGYAPRILAELQLASSKELILNIELKENVSAITEVQVIAIKEKNQAQNKMASVSARTFSIEETERYAGSLGDPSRMAKNFAGVSMGNDQRNDIIIRGNSPLGLLWRLDGFEIPNPNHFGAIGTTGGPISMLNNNLLTNSDFFTGAFPAEYGNANSGVFDLKMRNGNNEKHEFVGQAGFNGFEFGAEGPLSKKSRASYLINYRYSMLTLLQNIGIKLGKKNSDTRYQDVSFKCNFPVTHGSFSIIGIGGLDKILVHKQTKRDTINSRMGMIGVSYTHFLTSKSRIEIKASGSTTQTIDNEYRNTNSQATFLPEYVSSFSEPILSLSITEQTKMNAANNITLGCSFTRTYSSFADSSHETDSWTALRNNSGSLIRYNAFGQWQHYFNDQLSITGGLHYQLLQYNKKQAIEPRIGLKYQIDEKQSVSAGAGMHSRVQPTIVYFTQQKNEAGQLYMPYTNLDLSKSIHNVVGYDRLVSKHLRFKTEVYYQHLYNVPVSSSRPQQSLINYGADFEITIPENMSTYSTAQNYGLELTLERFLSNNYYFLITSSIFESKYKDYNGTSRNTAFNNNFVCNALFGYEKPIGKEKQNSLTFNIRSTYAGGNPKIEIDLAQSIIKNKTVYRWDDAYQTRYPNYFRLDLRIGFKQNFKRFSHEIAIDLQNITARENILRESFDKESKQIEYEYQNGFFPMALYRINF